jgi:hypothetical protein
MELHQGEQMVSLAGTGCFAEIDQVENTDPAARPGEFSDLSAVEKFDLTPEEYASRSGEYLFPDPRDSELSA